MRDDVRRALRGLVLPTIVLAVVAAAVPGRLELAGRIYALLACAAALWVAVRGLVGAFPPARRLRPPRAPRARRPAAPRSLAQLENAVALAVDDPLDFHVRLRPQLRRLAEELLESRRGVVLDAQPETARAILGEETWELVRHERPTPDETTRARRLTPAALERVVVSLERL